MILSMLATWRMNIVMSTWMHSPPQVSTGVMAFVR